MIKVTKREQAILDYLAERDGYNVHLAMWATFEKLAKKGLITLGEPNGINRLAKIVTSTERNVT